MKTHLALWSVESCTNCFFYWPVSSVWIVYSLSLINPLTVLRAQALCTTAAVLGGKSLATQISEKMVRTELVSNSFSVMALVPVSCEVWNTLHLSRCLSCRVGGTVKWSTLPAIRHHVIALRARWRIVIPPGNLVQYGWLTSFLLLDDLSYFSRWVMATKASHPWWTGWWFISLDNKL